MATCEKRGDSYKITVSCGYDLNYKQIRKNMTWTPTPGMTTKQIEKELERQKLLFEEKCRNGQILEKGIRFADFAEIWFRDYAEKQLKAKTLNRYKGLMKRINAALGHIHLEKLQPHHLLSFYANLQEDGVREDIKYFCKVDFKAMLKQMGITKVQLSESAGVAVATLNSMTQGKNINEMSVKKVSIALNIEPDSTFSKCASKKLSSRTIQHYHKLISSILNTAVQWQVIFSSPCERIKPPKVEQTQPKFFDDLEVIKLIELLDKEPVQYSTMIKLLLYTGFRRGELCGLEWDDIDFKNNIIHICRESLYLPEKGIYDDIGKTNSSIRSIKVSSSVTEMLKEYKIWQSEEKLKIGDRWENSSRLFTSWCGKPIYPGNLTGWFGRFIKRHNLPSMNIHGLRHTNASLMIANGTPITTVAKRLGHANAMITGKIYAHAIKTADEIAAEKLEDIFNSALSK